jgi:hypothetical protein
MATRQELVKALPAAGTAFVVGSHQVLDDSPARAQGAAARRGTSIPRVKRPSKFAWMCLGRRPLIIGRGG